MYAGNQQQAQSNYPPLRRRLYRMCIHIPPVLIFNDQATPRKSPPYHQHLLRIFLSLPTFVLITAHECAAKTFYGPVRRHIEFNAPKFTIYIQRCLSYGNVRTSHVNDAAAKAGLNTSPLQHFIQYDLTDSAESILRMQKPSAEV